MHSSEPVHPPRRSVLHRLVRIILRCILTILIVLIIVVLLLQTPYIQNIIRGKAETYLARKLKTRVKIGRLYIRFPQTILLGDIYVEDRQKDTLLSAGLIRVDMHMWALLHSKVDIGELQLDDITMKISRHLPDSVYNFQFIADAFAGTPDTTVKKNEPSAMKFMLQTLSLDKIRLVYKDEVTGDDATIWLGHSRTKMVSFDPSSPNPLQLGQFGLVRSSLEYRNTVSAFYASLQLGRLNATMKLIDLTKKIINLQDFRLDSTTVAIQMGKVQKTRVPARASSKGANTPDATSLGATDSSGDWRFAAAVLQLNGDNIRYDDDNQPRQKKGMDYFHLKVDGLSLLADRLAYNKDSISGTITKGQLKEQSGFQLDKLQTDFLYADKEAYLKNLELRTPGTFLRRSAMIKYTSLAGIMKDPAHTLLDMDLSDCRVQVKDILTFAPMLSAQPAFSHPGDIWQINARLRGSLAVLRVESLKFSGLVDTKVELSGTIQHVTDPKRITGLFTIRNISGSQKGLAALLPPGTIPSNIALPATFSLQGTLGGGMDDIKSDLTIRSSSGMVILKGTASKLTDFKRVTYDMDVKTQDLDLGYILRDSLNFGKVTAGFLVRGQGFDVKTANAEFSGQIESAVVRKFEYNDFGFNGSLAGGHAAFQSAIQDTAIRFTMQATAELTNKYPGIKLDWQIDTLDLHAMHLLSDTMTFKGHLKADFASTNPDSLQGKLSIDSIVWHDGIRTMVTDSLVFLAERTDANEHIMLRSEMADLDWNGRYKITELSQALKQTLNHYYRINGFRDTVFSPQDWKMDLLFRTSPMVLAYMPSLKGTDTIGLHLAFNSNRNDLHGLVLAPRVQYGSQIFRQVNLAASTEDKQLQYDLQIAGIAGSGFQLRKTSLYGNLANDELHTSLLLKDEKDKDWYRLTGLLDKKAEGLTFALNPDSLLLNYDRWQVSKDNSINYDSSGLVVRDFVISNKDESLKINSSQPVATSPIDVNFSNFRISTLTRFAGQDSLLADGLLNGAVQVKNVLTNPVFTSDLQIKNLSYRQDSIGDLSIKVNNEKANAFSADISLKGHQNDIHASGDYHTGEGLMDLKLDLGQLNMVIFKPLSAGQLSDIKGLLKGQLAITGTMAAPVVNGRLHFDSAVITPMVSGEPLKLSNDNIEFDQDGFNFSQFAFADSSGNKATIDGNVYTKNYRDYGFALSVYASNFRLVNAQPATSRLFYGKLNVDATINLKGDMASPKVDGDIRVNKKTDFVFVLPGSNPEVADREGVVRFVDEAHRTDTLTQQAKAALADLARRSDVKGVDISLRIATDSSANFTMIIDERSGDALTARGRSNLVFGMDKSGKMDLTGGYEVESGSYNLSLDVLKRKFQIERGSTITWTGDPTTADLDITATYTVNTPSIDLIANEISGRTQTEINKFKQKLPFLVTLKMEGELLKPKITFDITLPTSVLSLWPDVDAKLQQIRVQESEMNKQVFALLLLNRFVGEDPLQSAAGGGSSIGNMAFQSASQILTSQLDQLAASLIKGVDIHFDLNNQQDFSTGTENDYTELNVSVSKRFFNDRIQVNVGSNFDVAGSSNPNQQAANIAGDLAVDYKLSEDGRYMLRAYRKNQYEMAVEGQVVETGVSFILTFDYNRFKEIFMKVQKLKQLEQHNTAPVPKADTKPKESTNQ